MTSASPSEPCQIWVHPSKFGSWRKLHLAARGIARTALPSPAWMTGGSSECRNSIPCRDPLEIRLLITISDCRQSAGGPCSTLHVSLTNPSRSSVSRLKARLLRMSGGAHGRLGQRPQESMEGFEISATFEAATLHELHHLPHRKFVTKALQRSDRSYRLRLTFL